MSAIKSKYSLYSVLFIFGLITVARLYFLITDDFHKGNILPNNVLNKKWEMTPVADLDQIFNQAYHYIGKGAQAYALLSEDGKFVIKLFKYKHLRTPFYLQALPFLEDYKKQKAEKVDRKIDALLSGYHTAYTLHKEETGLICLHYHNDHTLNRNLHLTDKMGRELSLDLDSYVFVVQKCCVKLRSLLDEILSQGKLDLAKKRILQVLHLYLTEYRKGIFDHDLGVMHNFGFIGEQPIHFDVGKLAPNVNITNPVIYTKEMERVTHKINAWLLSHYPQYQQEIATNIEMELTKWLNAPFHVPDKLS